MAHPKARKLDPSLVDDLANHLIAFSREHKNPVRLVGNLHGRNFVWTPGGTLLWLRTPGATHPRSEDKLIVDGDTLNGWMRMRVCKDGHATVDQESSHG
ncbi:hypothetical protein Peetri_00052 [Pseudomonas phage vB_PpuM-Peetri]